jgi:hypothetical protein
MGEVIEWQLLKPKAATQRPAADPADSWIRPRDQQTERAIFLAVLSVNISGSCCCGHVGNALALSIMSTARAPSALVVRASQTAIDVLLSSA